MRTLHERVLINGLVAAALSGVMATATAAPAQFEAVMTPKADSKFEFADGSKRYLVAAQREGKTTGTGPLAGANVMEWGMHDVNPTTGADANGYLVFTANNGDVAYLKYQFRAVPVPGPDGKPRFVANGFWETAGGTGQYKDMRGIGTLEFSPRERRWVLTGDLASNH